jgi:DNA repair photolyase
MSVPFEHFEQVGLKIDKERVLTYSKLSCPLECTYCFVDEMTQDQSKKVAYLSAQQFELLQNLPEQVKLIMLGCDTEFFQNKAESLQTLQSLSTLGKDISVITKLPLPKDFIAALSDVHKYIVQQGNIFSFSTSIPCLSDAILEKYEPRVPHPHKRIETLAMVHGQGIPTTVAIRPLLPDIDDDELLQIIHETKEHCFGYYSGPLYLKEDNIKTLLPDYVLDMADEHQPHWMLEGNRYHACEKDGQMERLAALVCAEDREFFSGAAEAVEFLRTQQSHEESGNKSQA